MKILKTFIVILFTLSCFSIEAKEYKVDEIPIVHLQDKSRYVSNPDNIISAEAVMAMDTTLYALEQKTGIQALVVVVSGIEGSDCFDFAQQLGQKYGIGEKKRDNGLVILLSTDERCVQFATGYGIEGDLPDALCKRIQTKYMVPYFSEGDWSKGMVEGVTAVRGYLDGSMKRENNPEVSGDAKFFLTFAFGLTALIFGALFVTWWNKRCPVCKKHKIQRVSSALVSKENGIRIDAVKYKCLNCGHTFVKNERSSDDDYRGPRGGSGGPIIFGGFGRGGGGGGFGGFGGGSYGGGSFGGGGAGSRF
ncbi:TPM domain-containing protein [Phocaeicola paurosaccharolyticus]|jgi:uncharacterized protein|uniref:TPM domain-containing protein n=1 Tax=Phocaeicola paurosaccharolyticus TaxID=732242 RepID=UPI002FE1440A